MPNKTAIFDINKSSREISKQLKEVLRKCIDDPDQNISSLTPLFTWEGKPITLSDHVFFKSLFKLRRPKRRLLKCARQTGKSFDVVLASSMTHHLIPGYRQLFVSPLHSQVIRLSKEYYGPFAARSFMAPFMLSGDCIKNELHRTLANESAAFFSYAFNNVDRIRGFANIHEVTIDEVQDMIFEFVPIIGQTMAAAVGRGFYTFAGTPKTFDNTIQRLWDDTSRGEWETKCHGCGYWNRASAEADLIKMIGLKTVICAKCGKPIDPVSDGKLVHGVPALADEFESLHVPQIIHPYHYRHYDKWRDILYSMKGDETTFYNEILGESRDSADRLCSFNDIKDAAVLGPNTDENAFKHLKDCSRIIMAIDWSGGGESGKSTTAIAICCQKPFDDVVKVVRLIRLPRAMTPEDEIARIIPLIKKYKVWRIAHDYAGGGNIRESALVTAGIPRDRIAPFSYGWFPSGAVITEHCADVGSRNTYNIDKSRSLYIMSQMIRSKKILLPSIDESKWHLDFLALTEEPLKRPMGGDRKFVGRARGGIDDIAHAVNFGASALWYLQRSYPKIVLPTSYTMDPNEMEVGADLRMQ